MRRTPKWMWATLTGLIPWWIWTILAGLIIGVAVAESIPANADPVDAQVINYAAHHAEAICDTLDDYPTIVGVEGILQGIHEGGHTSFQSGEIIAVGVNIACPQHIQLLQRFAAQSPSQGTKI